MQYFLICVCALITLWAAVEQLRDTHGNLRSALVYFVKRIMAFHKGCSLVLEYMITATFYVLYVVINAVFPSDPPRKQRSASGDGSKESKKPSGANRFATTGIDRDDPPEF